MAIALGLAEYARGHVLTGLPWNLIGYGLLATLPLMQLAALFGVYALSLLAVLLFASPAADFRAGRLSARRRQRRGRAGLRCSSLCLGSAMCGASAGSPARRQASTGLRLRIVQADIDQAKKWRPENSAEIFTDYLDLTKSGDVSTASIS